MSQAEFDSIRDNGHCFVCHEDVTSDVHEHLDGPRHQSRQRRIAKCIVRDSVCIACNVDVSPHIRVALAHVQGRRHVEQLQKSWGVKRHPFDSKLTVEEEDEILRCENANAPDLQHGCPMCSTADFGAAHRKSQQHIDNRRRLVRLIQQFGSCNLSCGAALYGLSYAEVADHLSSGLHLESLELENEAASVSVDTQGCPSTLITYDSNLADEWVKKHVVSRSVTKVGLDTESATRKGRPNELAFVQIATPSDEVLIYRAYGQSNLPFQLLKLLGNPEIVKYSVGPEKELEYWCMSTCSSMVDVQVRDLRANGNRQSTTDLAAKWAPEHGYSKSKSLQVSNWSAWPLSREQVEYAAKDAIIALAIGTAMDRKRATSSGFIGGGMIN